MNFYRTLVILNRNNILLPSKQAKTAGNLNQKLANSVNLPNEVIFHIKLQFIGIKIHLFLVCCLPDAQK